LQTLTEPGTVLICPHTRQLTGGHFDYRDLGALALKGWTEPVQVWQVLRASGVESRFEAMHKTKLPPLFGREEEIELLLRRWRHVREGEGRVGVVTGSQGSASRTLRSRWASGSRMSRTSRCAISVRPIIPTALSSHSLATSNVLPGLSAATRLRRSSPNLTLWLRNPRRTRNTWRFWPACSHYRPAIATDCTS